MDIDWEPAWQEDDWGPLERQSAEAITDESGRFSFKEEILGAEGSVVWASHPEHTAACILLDPEDPLAKKSWTIELPSAHPMVVRVVDSAGTPAPGATVVQFGLTPPGAVRGADGRTPERARRLLVRRIEADASGSVNAGPFPGEQVLIASDGVRNSLPWRGEPQSEIVLSLAGAFSVGGTVRFPDWSHLNYVGERRLLVEASRGSESFVLLSRRPILDGAWGPCSIPILEGASYSLRLEGSPIIPVLEEFGAPAPGEQLAFHLLPALGHGIAFYAEDGDGHAIPEAQVASYWEENGRERVLRRRGEPDGHMYNWSFPEGALVRSFVSAPGFAGQWTDAVHVPEPSPTIHRIVLEKSAALKGRCTYAGKPVEDFEVVVWQPRHSRFTQIARTFRGREEGTFELDAVPLGELEVSAATESLPFSPSVHVTLPTEREVVLELWDPVRGFGEIVDLETGRSVKNALVQPIATISEGPLRPWGKPHPADEQGRFSIRGFSAGGGTIRIRAEGFAERQVQGYPRGGEIDFGRIQLDRPRPLELRLFADEPCDFTGVTAFGDEGSPLPRRSFDARGLLRFESAPVGVHYVAIEGIPQASWVSMRLDLIPGREWRAAHKVAGRRRLSVEIVGQSDEVPSSIVGMSVCYVNREGISTELGVPFPTGGSLSIDGIDADSALIAVLGPLRIKVGALAELEGEELHAVLDLGGPALRVRVVDASSAPIPGVLVRITDSQPSGYYCSTATDGSGVCALRGVPQRTLLASLEHEIHGRLMGATIDGRAQEVTLVLANDAALDLLIRDGTEPLPGVDAKALISTVGPRWSPLGSSNDQGRVFAGQLSEGLYRITAEHPDCWPQTIEAAASREPAPIEVQVRRRGSLVLQLWTSEGVPISSRSIELVSTEFGEDVGRWADEGLVTAPSGLVSDGDGEVRIERLPRGSYRWAVPTSSGERLEGVCEVPAARLLQFPIVVP